MFGIYFVILCYYLSAPGILQLSIFLAELSAIAFNLRTIYIKITKNKTLLVEVPFLTVYILCRCILNPYYTMDYYKTAEDRSNLLVAKIFLFWLVSIKWSYTMIRSTYHSLCIKN